MVRRRRQSRPQAAIRGRREGRPSPKVTRRSVLKGAAATAVIVLIGGEEAFTAGDVDADGGGPWAKGVVQEAGPLAVVRVLADEHEFLATPVHFPNHWEFHVGDWVGVDLARKEVCPFLSSAEAVAGEIKHVMPNDDPTLSRRVRRRQVTSP